MADSSKHEETTTERFIRGAGEVREDPEHKMWAPARWVVQMVQYLIAIIVLTMVEGIRAIVTGEKPSKKKKAAREE